MEIMDEKQKELLEALPKLKELNSLLTDVTRNLDWIEYIDNNNSWKTMIKLWKVTKYGNRAKFYLEDVILFLEEKEKETNTVTP